MVDLRRALIAGSFLLPFMVLAGCGNEGPLDISEADLVGDYEATTLEVTQNGVTSDFLAEGGSLTITLNSDGTTTGTLVIPPSESESGMEEEVSMAGTWTLSGAVITFEQSSDTLVRDVEFEAAEGRLEGMEEFPASGTAVEIVLLRIE